MKQWLESFVTETNHIDIKEVHRGSSRRLAIARTRLGLSIAEMLGKHCVAQEGAYGTYLLSEDMTQSSLMFGRKGLLRPHDLGLKDGFGLQPKQV